MQKHYYKTSSMTPVGVLQLVASDKGLCGVYFSSNKKDFPQAQRDDNHPVLRATQQQLEEYFAGERKDFDLPLDMQGTVFQIKAWRALQQIPYGQTYSYGQQAEAIGDKKKARAVGMANGRNPLSIVVPCHRVVGANGSLTGFGGGLQTKQRLLEHEQKYSAA